TQAVGRPQAHGADSAAAELLGDLGENGQRLAVHLDGHLDRGVDLGERAARELHVHHRAGDGDDAAVLQLWFGHGHGGAPCRAAARAALSSASMTAPAWRWLLSSAPRASAPPTISMISVVMASWRARFITRVRFLMSSSALSVALFIARW